MEENILLKKYIGVKVVLDDNKEITAGFLQKDFGKNKDAYQGYVNQCYHDVFKDEVFICDSYESGSGTNSVLAIPTKRIKYLKFEAFNYEPFELKSPNKTFGNNISEFEAEFV